MAMQQMGSVFASSSSSSSSVLPWKKYDVFLSFRGEDTRNNFTSHLYDTLCRKNVETFKDDNELEKGDEISPALFKAIEESYVSIVIFSENYATSKWCLNELIRILECKEDQGQIVIPVFYEIDPSHVRKQTGSYKQAFAKHEWDWKLKKVKLKEWKDALFKAASLVGWDSRDRSESDLIKAIVEDVLEKLKKLKPGYPSDVVKGLVGVEKNLEQMESLLNIGSNSNGVRIIGIWGMGGLGKTTLAIALHAKLHTQFEGHCFLAKVREKSNNQGLDSVLMELLSALLEKKNLRHDAPWVDIPSIQRRLARKKVFIVLDDVDTSEQIEDLILKYNCLGPGSRVIVTTRDKSVFSQFDECEIYKAKELNENDSLQLFCSIAFREKHPKIGYEDLSTSAIAYCKGNPLALKVLGASLRPRSKEAWTSELNKLQRIPNMKIHNVLKLSYDGLDRIQKDIFLDIACFLKGWHRDRVSSILEADFFATSGIEDLLDKALIELQHPLGRPHVDCLEMHDLIQEMGREIVNQESKSPGKRSRLWKPEEVYDVLKNSKGIEVVEGITFDTAEVGILYLNHDSFKGMTELRFLDIYDSSITELDGSCKVYIPGGLGWLSDRLRYLHWHAFSLQSLPPAFHPKMLVELHMPHSKLKKFWDGVQDLENLKEIDLRGSEDLIEVPDLSRAPNLERVFLTGCESLRQLHPSILPLPKLMLLDLGGLKKMESLKTDIHSKSLCVLNLDDCSSLTEFSVTSEEMTQLTLRGTAIRELSSSIWRNSKLTYLGLAECNGLNVVGNKLSNDPGLGSLTELLLYKCSQINASNLWFILDGIRSLEWLHLSECCDLEAIPDNIQNHSMMKGIVLENCRKLVSLPAELPSSLQLLEVVNCTSLDTQGPLLENMLQSMSYIQPHTGDWDAFICLPGAQVPGKFEFHTTKASITIPPIPTSDLCGFIFCTILSEDINALDNRLDCSIYEHDKEVHCCSLSLSNQAHFFSDHALLWWYRYNIEESRGDHYNLSFSFEFKNQYFDEKDKQWSTVTKGIKGCGILPVYASELGLELDGSSSSREEIVRLEPNAEISYQSDQHLEMDIDDSRPRANGGETGASNNGNGNENEVGDMFLACYTTGEIFLMFFVLVLSCFLCDFCW